MRYHFKASKSRIFISTNQKNYLPDFVWVSWEQITIVFVKLVYSHMGLFSNWPRYWKLIRRCMLWIWEIPGEIPNKLLFNFDELALHTLAAHNWQKWKRVFLTCPCHEIYRDEAVGLKSCKNTWKITIFVKMWNLGQYRENLIFCQ